MSSTRPIIPCTKTVSVPCGWEKNLRNAKPNMPCYRIAFITSELQSQKSQGSTTFPLLPEFLSHKGRRITGTPKAASSFHRTWPNHSIYRFLLQPWYSYSWLFSQFSGYYYSSHFWFYSLFTNWALFPGDLAREGTQVQPPELFHPGLELEKSKPT